MRFPSFKTVLSTTSSIFYCIRQGIVFWRIFKNKDSHPQTEEQLDSALQFSDSIVDAAKDSELTSCELKTIYERLGELRESFDFVNEDKEKQE